MRATDRIYELRRALVADGKLRGIPISDQDCSGEFAKIRKNGVSYVYETLPTFGRQFDRGLVSGVLEIPLDTKGLNVPFPELWKRVFEDEKLSRNPCLETIRFLRQYLLLDSKVVRPPTIEQSTNAVQVFIDQQKALSKIKVPVGHPVLELAKSYLTLTLKRLDLSAIDPGHGPGVVVEKLDADWKWLFTSWPRRVERKYPFCVYGLPSYYHLPIKGVPLYRRKPTKCCLVPKDFRGPRLISAEPAAMQYLQQGQLRKLVEHVKRSRVLSRSIDFGDQTPNQRRAQKAYANGEVTVDLSSASDTLSASLVWYLLSGVPDVRRYLFTVRSTHMSTRSGDVKLYAFAPMGSAICFPVETLMFWALSMGSVALTRSTRNVVQGEPLDFVDGSATVIADLVRVFGDDIIIPDSAFPILSQVLTEVGCQVNTHKTCYRTPFRESCGSEWFNGHDVTIIRNRSLLYEKAVTIQDDIRHRTSVVDLQRKFFFGWPTTASLLVGWASKETKHRLPIIRFDWQAASQGKPWSRFDDLSDGVDADCRLSASSGSIPELCSISRTRVDAYKHLSKCFYCRSTYATLGFPFPLGWEATSNGLPLRWSLRSCRTEVKISWYRSCTRAWNAPSRARLLARLRGINTMRIPVRGEKPKTGWIEFDSQAWQARE